MSVEAPKMWRVGRARVTITGPECVVTEPARHWSVFALGLDWSDTAEIAASFDVDPSADATEDGSFLVEIAVQHAVEVLVALIRTAERTFAVAATTREDRAVWAFDASDHGASVHVLAFADADAAASCLDWFGGAIARPPVLPLPLPPLTTRSASRPQTPSDLAPPEAPDTFEGRTPGVQGFASGEMPASPRVGERTTVVFRLSRESVKAGAGNTIAGAPLQVARETPLTVSISLRGYRLAAGRRTRSIRFPTGTTPTSRRFAVEPIDAGPGEVSFAVRQGDEHPLVTLRLTTEIVDGPTAAGTSEAVAAAEHLDPAFAALPTLRIDESLAGGRSSLDIGAEVGTHHVTASIRGLDKKAIVATTYEKIGALRRKLEQGVDGTLEARVAYGLEQLRKIGVELARQLLPPRVRRLLWDNLADLRHIVIQTTGEFDVPWELLYLSDPDRSAFTGPVRIDQFLGMRGATRWVYNTAAPTRITVRQTRARYLCPDYRYDDLALAFTHEEGAFVRRRFDARAVAPSTANAMSKAITAGFDLLHFAGHGVWIEDPPDQRLLLERFRRSRTPAKGSSYAASDLRHDLPDLQMVVGPDAPSMVVLNACDVGRIDTSSVGSGGFPEAFLRGGVGVLIGCSWVVGDRTAGQFIRDFYEALTESDIGTAVLLARRTALANGDLSSLAYVAYAHPHATVTTAV